MESKGESNPAIIGALENVTHKLEKWFQQIQQMILRYSQHQKSLSVLLGTIFYYKIYL